MSKILVPNRAAVFLKLINIIPITSAWNLCTLDSYYLVDYYENDSDLLAETYCTFVFEVGMPV